MVSSSTDLKNIINEVKQTVGPLLLEITINKGARPDLGRPTSSPIENKNCFMKFLN